MERARNVPLVALRLLADVEHLHGALLEQLLQLVQLHGVELLRHRHVGDVTGELEEPDGTQPARRLGGLGFVRGMDDDSFRWIQHEACARRER